MSSRKSSLAFLFFLALLDGLLLLVPGLILVSKGVLETTGECLGGVLSNAKAFARCHTHKFTTSKNRAASLV
jgi:hypothetical protein